jgi:hypothetical protein
MSPASLTELALVFANPSQRPAINAGLSMIDALNLTLPPAGTEDAQLTRLAWWDAELQRYLAGAPEHPATQALTAQGLAVLQAPYWQTLIHAQARRITTPNPDGTTLQEIATSMGAGFGAITTLLGMSTQVDHYQNLGGANWLIEQLMSLASPHAEHTMLMEAAANQLAEVGRRLTDTPDGAAHRFAVVLAKLYQCTAQREVQQVGTGVHGPITRVWVAWRTAMQVR